MTPTDQRGYVTASQAMRADGHVPNEQTPSGPGRFTMKADPRPVALHAVYGAERQRRTQAEKWLYAAATSREVAASEWAGQGVALLTAGTMWDAVRVPYAVLDPNLERDTAPARRRLNELQLAGPVFCDPYRLYLYVLVPPSTDRQWPSTLAPAGVVCLGGTRSYIHHVGVPRLDRTAPPGPHWLTPPDGTGRLTDFQHLYQVLHARAGEVAKLDAPMSAPQVIA